MLAKNVFQLCKICIQYVWSCFHFIACGFMNSYVFQVNETCFKNTKFNILCCFISWLLFVILRICLFVFICVDKVVCLSLCLAVCLLVCLTVCLLDCLFIWPKIVCLTASTRPKGLEDFQWTVGFPQRTAIGGLCQKWRLGCDLGVGSQLFLKDNRGFQRDLLVDFVFLSEKWCKLRTSWTWKLILEHDSVRCYGFLMSRVVPVNVKNPSAVWV